MFAAEEGTRRRADRVRARAATAASRHEDSAVVVVEEGPHSRADPTGTEAGTAAEGGREDGAVLAIEEDARRRGIGPVPGPPLPPRAGARTTSARTGCAARSKDCIGRARRPTRSAAPAWRWRLN